MKKIIKDNLKKITALLLVASMILPPNISVFAQEVIEKDVTIQDEIAQNDISKEDIAQNESIVEKDIHNYDTQDEISNELVEDSLEEVYPDGAEAGYSGVIPIEDEKARERECITKLDGENNPLYINKLLTYLSLKYPDIHIDPQYGIGANLEIDVAKDRSLHDEYNFTRIKRQKEYDEIIIDGNDTFEGYSDLTKNMVQFRDLSLFDGSPGGTYGDNNTVKTLIIRNVDEIRNLRIPQFVETLIIENTTINCYTPPGFQDGVPTGDLEFCKNLKKLVLKNVKFGDNYKYQKYAALKGAAFPYETNYKLNLMNCHNLDELEIDVSFDGAKEVQLAIDGGAENLFEHLTADKCKINPAPGTGYGQLKLYANPNSNLAKFYDAAEAVKFENGQFRLWLIEAMGIDTNLDGVISQAEMDAIETLTINDQTAHSAEQTSLSAFHELADIKKMHGLKTLEIDFYDPSYSYNANRHPLKGIDFPDSLENLTMKNIYWEKDTETKSHDNADIVLTNLRTLELYNTDVKVESGDRYFNHSTKIELTDTEGVLESCIIDRTDVESVKLINNSEGKGVKGQDEKQRIRFSASDCQNLKTIEFLGKGYAVEGSLDLTNDTALTHIGVPNEDKSVWTVYGEFDSTFAPINVILNSCTELGSDCGETVIDYNFINGRNLNVQAMDTRFSDAHKLSICRNHRITDDTAGTVYLSCDSTGDNVWLYNYYTEEFIDEAGDSSRKAKDGFVIENRASFPTIAVFANGQRIRTSGEGNHNDGSIYTEDSDRWVERWDLVMAPGGYSSNFGNLSFYVVDKTDGEAGNTSESLRKVNYGGKDDKDEAVYVEWDQQDDTDPIITLPTVQDDKTGGYKLTGSRLSSTGKPGEVELKLYVYNADGYKSYIGYQNIKIFKMPDSVELINDGTERGSGTKDDPYIIDKGEELKLKARNMVNGDVDRAGDYALRDVYWRIKEYDEPRKYTSDSDGYSLYTLDTATKAGISVVRGELNNGESEEQYDRRTDNTTYYNHRRFSFDTTGLKYKIVAQSPYKNNDTVITKEVYVEYHSKPLSIDISNDIIHGKTGSDEATITINDAYNINSVNVSIKNPELYDNCFIVNRDPLSTEGKDIWKLRINNSDNVKVKNIINSSTGSLTLVINADDKTYENIINISSEYVEETEEPEVPVEPNVPENLDELVDISNDIVHGKFDYDEATITIKGAKNAGSVSVSIKNPELYEDCFTVNRDSMGIDDKEIWKLRINNSDVVKVKNIINSNKGSITLVISINDKKIEKTINLSSAYPDEGIYECLEIDDQIYTGKAIKPRLNVFYGPVRLVEGKDYTVSYSNNVKAASKTAVNARGKNIDPSVTIKCKGNYSYKVTRYFSIIPCSIKDSAKVDDVAVNKTGKDIKIKPRVVINGKKLSQGKDYVVSTTTDEQDAIVSLKEANEYSLYIVGKGNYAGAIPFKFTITTSVIASKAKIQKIANQIYNDGAEVKPDINIKYKGKNVTDCFDIRYENNIEIGTATVIVTAKKTSTGEEFKGEAGYSFAGTNKATFKINGLKIKDTKLGLDGKEKIPEFVYSGNENKPKPNLYYKTDTAPLVENKDYTIEYLNNINAGTATILIKGKGKYYGTKTIKFKIKN